MTYNVTKTDEQWREELSPDAATNHAGSEVA